MTFEERQEVLLRASEAGYFEGLLDLWWPRETEARAVESAHDGVVALLGEVPLDQRLELILTAIYGRPGPALHDACRDLVADHLRRLGR